MTKRISYFVIAICFVFFCFPFWSNAEDQAKYLIESKTVSENESFEISIIVDNEINKGFLAGGFKINYDETIINLDNIEVGSAINSYSKDGFIVDGSTVIYLKDDYSMVTESGEVAKLHFNVNKGASGKNCVISLDSADFSVLGGNGEGWFVDETGTAMNLIPTIEIGNIVVRSNSLSLPTSSITDSTKGAATVTGTVDNGTATLNVACDKACVVAYTTDNGETYNRLTAKANSEGNYDFIVPETYTDTMKFAVAVKGDLNGDGETDGTDASQIERFEAGLRTLTPLQVLACDINGDGEVSGTDASQIERVDAGFRTLAWDN